MAPERPLTGGDLWALCEHEPGVGLVDVLPERGARRVWQRLLDAGLKVSLVPE